MNRIAPYWIVCYIGIFFVYVVVVVVEMIATYVDKLVAAVSPTHSTSTHHVLFWLSLTSTWS